ncbi:hypothetical protein STAS_26436 [Striga asiatica]|uniref:Uncharacterized protein n=1 Tax=Striga asiatica TaxID=4170 RepID=A0A5A7QW84_STRAF|nr:hypothetical protein STAS_26436 [Striga asiatica]
MKYTSYASPSPPSISSLLLLLLLLLANASQLLDQLPLLPTQPLGNLHLHLHQLISPHIPFIQKRDPLFRHHKCSPRLSPRRDFQIHHPIYGRHFHRRPENRFCVRHLTRVQYIRLVPLQNRVFPNLNRHEEVSRRAPPQARVPFRPDPEPAAGVDSGGDFQAYPLGFPEAAVAAAGGARGGGLAGAAAGRAGGDLLEDSERGPRGGDDLALAGARSAGGGSGAGFRAGAVAGRAGVEAGDLDFLVGAEDGIFEIEDEGVELVLALRCSAAAGAAAHALEEGLEEVKLSSQKTSIQNEYLVCITNLLELFLCSSFSVFEI